MGRAWVFDGRAAQCARASTRKRKNKWLPGCALHASQRASTLLSEREAAGLSRASERTARASERERAREREAAFALARKVAMASCAQSQPSS